MLEELQEKSADVISEGGWIYLEGGMEIWRTEGVNHHNMIVEEIYISTTGPSETMLFRLQPMRANSRGVSGATDLLTLQILYEKVGAGARTSWQAPRHRSWSFRGEPHSSNG